MSKHAQWLREQLAIWQAEGLVSTEQADRLRARYPEPQGGPPWGILIFAGLGAIVGGLGVILLLAYNWDDIPKAAKLALIFLSIIAAHGTGLRFFAKRDWRKPLGEALSLLGTMLYGAGIWLVAQIYHIDEHFPIGFLLWAVGALILAWAMPSVAQAIIATVLFAIWACVESIGFNQAPHYAPYLILVLIGALSWRLHSRVLLAFCLAAFTVTLLTVAGNLSGGLILTMWVNAAAVFLAVGKLSERHNRFAEGGPIWQFFGWLGILMCLYLFTFAGILDDLVEWPKKMEKPMVAVYAWAALAVTVVAWIPLVVDFVRRRKTSEPSESNRWELWMVPLIPVLVQVIAVWGLADLKWFIAGPFNLAFLALSATWMARGCRKSDLKETVLGSLLFTALVVARYFDLFESLATRGLVFLIVGAVLFGEGLLFMRTRRARTEAPV